MTDDPSPVGVRERPAADHLSAPEPAPDAAADPARALRLPDFVLVGAMKAGSTSLARYLGAHPQVYMAPGKEVHFFDRHFERGHSWYAGHFGEASACQVIGEATPNYLFFEDAVRRMAATIPGARLLVVLRNPIDRAYSHYWHERARGRETLSFERAIEEEVERLASDDPQVRQTFSYVAQGRYFEQLTRLVTYYPREAVHVLLFEDLRQDPVAAFRAVCTFLGVDDRKLPENLGRPYNEFTSFRSLLIRDLARALSARPHGLRVLGRILGRLNSRRRPYPAMPARLKLTLARRYESTNQALASWLGRDLSAWQMDGSPQAYTGSKDPC